MLNPVAVLKSGESHESFREILGNALASALMNALLGVFLAAMMLFATDPVNVFWPVALMCLVQLARLRVYFCVLPALTLSESRADTLELLLDRYAVQYWLLTLLTGICWGVITALVVSHGDVEAIALTMVVVAGVVSGGMSVMSAMASYYVPYVFCALLPIVLTLPLTGDRRLTLYAVLTVIFGCYLLVTNTLKWRVNQRKHAQYAAREKMVAVLEKRAAKADLQAKHLSKLSMLDDTTGLANKRHFAQFLESLLDTPPSERKFVVVLCEVVGVRDLNDRLGRRLAEQSLIAVAEVLRAAAFGDGHLVARTGGDIFGVVVPGKDEQAGNALVNSAKRRLAEVRSQLGPNQAENPLDAKFGVLPVDAKTPAKNAQDLLLLAEQKIAR